MMRLFLETFGYLKMFKNRAWREEDRAKKSGGDSPALNCAIKHATQILLFLAFFSQIVNGKQLG